MKKLIAVLLSLSMLTALAGCSKKSEETTKKTKKTKDTKVTETEAPTETETEPTETTEETTETEETTTTNATFAPGKDYPVSADFAISEDLTNVDYDIESTYRGYGRIVGDDRQSPVASIRKDIELIRFSPENEEQYSQLWNTLEANHVNLDHNYNNLYDQKLPDFVASLDNGQYKTDINMESGIDVFRADTQYFNYLTWQDYSEPSLENGSVITHNYRTSDGGEIMFDEVVTDRAGFAAFFEEYICGAEEYEYLFAEARELAKKISNEEEYIDFLIGYDAIYIVNNINGSRYYDLFKIPAMFAGDYIDVSYFGSTPENYILGNDVYDRITWDLDKDGDLDNVAVKFEKDEYDCIMGASIIFDGTMETPIPGNELAEDLISFTGMKLMSTDSGYYAYVSFASEEADPEVYIFFLEENAFIYIGKITGNFCNRPAYDPARFEIRNRNDIFGTGEMTSICSVIGNEGMPKKVEQFCAKDGLGVNNKEFQATLVELDGAPVGSAKIPADTTIRAISIDLDNNWIICSTLEEDESKNIVFVIDVAINDDGTITYCGKDNILQDDMFSGLRYAG